jgi:hypothetical protein
MGVQFQSLLQSRKVSLGSDMHDLDSYAAKRIIGVAGVGDLSRQEAHLRE